MKTEIIRKIKSREAIVGVIGLGYVGLPRVLGLLDAGFTVLGFDIDPKKISKLNKGENYIKHIKRDFLNEYVIEKKQFIPTSKFARLKESDVVIICVPTPLDEHFVPDLSYIGKSVLSVTWSLKKGHVIIIESTTYPGATEEEVLPVFEASGMTVGEDFYLGYSPLRDNPGNPDFSPKDTPKVTSAITADGLEIVNALYEELCPIIPVENTRVAEASKILENTYRAVNIALVNELQIIFDRLGINIFEVIEAAKTKPFGYTPFYPGPGAGGHCVPVDPFYLVWKAREYDVFSRFIEEAGMINNYMPHYVVSKVVDALNKNNKAVNESKILILGLAYKPNIDDDRESPSIKIYSILKEMGAQVDYYDPHIPHRGPLRKYPALNIHSIEYTSERLKEYDLLLLLTCHKIFPYDEIRECGVKILDVRNIFRLMFKC